MSVKLIGALLILTSGSSIGWILAAEYMSRVSNLKDLQSAINIFNTEISYTQTFLPQALKKTGVSINYPVSVLFKEAARRLSNHREKTFSEIWLEVLEEKSNIYTFTDDDIKVINEWANQIGSSSLEEQKKLNKLILKRLEQAEKRAQDIADKRVKLLRYAGVLVSLLVIILFY